MSWASKVIATGVSSPEAETAAPALAALTKKSAKGFGYATDLRSRTQGRATYSMHFDRYEPAPQNVSEDVVARMQGK